jgi:hypothetical protein
MPFSLQAPAGPPTRVIGPVLTIAAGLRRSQAKTLADPVAAARHAGRGTLSAVGRRLPSGTARNRRIKRVWHSCANDRPLPGRAAPPPLR